MELKYEWFKKRISELTGVAFDSYRPEQMKRLMEKMLDHFNVRTYVELIKLLESDPDKIREFKDNITINVTNLFRDAQKWWKLRDELLPSLVSGLESKTPPLSNGKTVFKTWSAGCSIGAEPYSLAILLEEIAEARRPEEFRYDFLSSDLDTTILARAKEGVFTEKELKDVPEKWITKYFNNIERPDRDWAAKTNAQHFHQVSPALKKNIRFKQQNLLDDAFEKDFHLIMCRNVIIYFNQDAKENLFQKFNNSLVPGGVLFIGGTEIIFNPEKWGFKNISMCFYKKIDGLV